MENEVVQLYLDDIIPNRFQPREVFNDQALKELAISIREHGVIQPIIVRKIGEKYEIIAGERRYKASTMAGLTKIPAIVRNLDDKESSKVALIENLQRRDLTPIEEARTYQKILDLDQMTQEDLAKTMGKSQSSVSNKLRLLTLPDEVQEALLKEEISERHARSLLNLSDKNKQVELLKEIIDKKMTVRDLDLRIKAINEGNSSSVPDTSTQSASGGISNQAQVAKVEELPPENNNTSIEKNVDSNNLGANDKMNVNNIVETNQTPTDTLPSTPPVTMQPVSDITSNVPVNRENDPTTVDINKIREQSFDINPNVPTKETKTKEDIRNLISPETNQSNDLNRFIPNNDEKVIEKTEDGNEVIGNGLLAGMPVIKPVANGNTPNTVTPVAPNVPSNNENSANQIINSSVPTSPVITTPPSSANVDSTSKVDASDIPENNNLFGLPETTITQNTTPTENSLFGVSANNSDNTSTPSLFGTSESKPQKDVNEAVSDIKKTIDSWNAKGYNVSVEELNLGNAVQLIIKIPKE